MVQIMDCMSVKDKKHYIIPIIIDAIKDEEDDERRYVGVVLIDELAQSLGAELCREHVMYDFISLQDDPIFKIRREVSLRLMRMSRVLGEQIFNGVIIPVYRKLSQDSIWSVRKACVEMLPEMSRISSQQIKKNQIMALFHKFSQDSSKWVKMATFQHFGPFIFSFENLDQNEVLLDYYLNFGRE